MKACNTGSNLMIVGAFITCLVWPFPALGTASPDKSTSAALEGATDIPGIVSEVQASSYQRYLLGLNVNEGNERGYDDEGFAQADLISARTAIADSLATLLGPDNVSLQVFYSNGYENGTNIIGILPGIGPRSNRKVIISAHYDSEENPGADDDGSGVAGVLEAARVLSKHQFDATLVFAAFDQEEIGARGSRLYARTCKGSKILGMISMDMIAFRPTDSGLISLSRCDSSRGSRSAKLLNRVQLAFETYTPFGVYALTGENASDPVRFYKAGFPALLVSEEFDEDGWPLNPYYYDGSPDYYFDGSGNPQQFDGRDYIDINYASQIVQGVVGWAATEAGLMTETPSINR